MLDSFEALVRDVAKGAPLSFLVAIFFWAGMLTLGWIEREQALLSFMLALIIAVLLSAVVQAIRDQL